VAFALVLLLVGVYIAMDGVGGLPTGWFGYAPNAYFVVRHYSTIRTVLVPIVLVVIWTAVSVWLLGPRADQSGEETPERPAE